MSLLKKCGNRENVGGRIQYGDKGGTGCDASVSPEMPKINSTALEAREEA